MSNTFSLADLCSCPDPCPECCGGCCDGSLPATLNCLLEYVSGGYIADITLTYNSGTGYWENTSFPAKAIFGCSGDDFDGSIHVTCSGPSDCTLFSMEMTMTNGNGPDTMDLQAGCVCPPDGPLNLVFICGSSQCDMCDGGSVSSGSRIKATITE